METTNKNVYNEIHLHTVVPKKHESKIGFRKVVFLVSHWQRWCKYVGTSDPYKPFASHVTLSLSGKLRCFWWCPMILRSNRTWQNHAKHGNFSSRLFFVFGSALSRQKDKSIGVLSPWWETKMPTRLPLLLPICDYYPCIVTDFLHFLRSVSAYPCRKNRGGERKMLKEGNLQSPQKPEVGIVEPPGMVHWEGQDVGMGMVVSRKARAVYNCGIWQQGVCELVSSHPEPTALYIGMGYFSHG